FGPRPYGLLLRQKTGGDMVGAGGSEEYAVAMKDLTRQIECMSQLFAAVARDTHSPWYWGKAEFLGKADGKGRIGEVIGEKTVVLRRQSAGLVAKAFRQTARLIEQHQPGALRHQFGIRCVADSGAGGPAANVLPVGQCQLAWSDEYCLGPVIMWPD